MIIPFQGPTKELRFKAENVKTAMEDLLEKLRELTENDEPLTDWFAIQLLITREY